jgi:glycosyltransferase involved in cell wall biosynthesis
VGELARRLAWQAVVLPRLVGDGTGLLTWSGMLPRRVSGHLVCYLANPLVFQNRGLGNVLRRAAALRTAAHARTVVVPTGGMADLVEGHLGRRPAVVPLAFAADRFTPATSTGTELLYVGDPYPHKRHDIALAAWAALPEPRPVLHLVGERGVDRAHFRQLEESIETHRQLGEIRVSSRIAAEELADVYRRARVLLITSERESFAMPLLEAQASGVPAVVRDQPSLRETGGDGTVYVAGDDPGVWAAAIQELLQNDAVHTRVRDAGLAHAAEYSWERTAEGLRRLMFEE